MAEIIEADRKIVNDDRIKIKVVGEPIEAHPVSPYDDDAIGYQTIRKSLVKFTQELLSYMDNGWWYRYEVHF